MPLIRCRWRDKSPDPTARGVGGGKTPLNRWGAGESRNLRPARGPAARRQVVVQRRHADRGVARGARRLPLDGDETARRFNDADTGSMSVPRHGWGMQRGRAAAPLPRLCCITAHILRTAFAVRFRYYVCALTFGLDSVRSYKPTNLTADAVSEFHP